jgi:hypothetical protein
MPINSKAGSIDHIQPFILPFPEERVLIVIKMSLFLGSKYEQTLKKSFFNVWH